MNKKNEKKAISNKLSAYIQHNKDSVYSFATQNTPVDSEGRAIIPQNDDWINEPEWDTIYEELDDD